MKYKYLKFAATAAEGKKLSIGNFHFIQCLTAAALAVGLSNSSAFASITYSGDTSDVAVVVVGNSTVGNLTIDGDSVLSSGSGIIGNNANSTGTVNVVSGAWTTSGILTVGDNGNGTLNLTSGSVTNSFSYIGNSTSGTGTVNVSGGIWKNYSTLMVGNSGSNNSLVIFNGGKVQNAEGAVGYNFGSSYNSVLVTGTNSLWTNTGINVGMRGTYNSLGISNGGKVQVDYAYIGNESASSNNTVTVTGAGSAWTSAQGVTVGSNGNRNRMVISDGGNVQNVNGFIGRYTNNASYNSVLVTGVNSTWTNTGNLNVGLGGSSNSVVVSNGGVVRNVNGSIGSQSSSGNNTVEVTGVNSAWRNTGTLTIYGNNTLSVANGGKVAANGGITSYGTLSGNGTIAANTTIKSGGSLAPGNSPGMLTVNGNLTLSLGSKYDCQVFSGSMDADSVDVNGVLTLDQTTLNLTNLGAYVTAEKFTLFAYESLSGTFAGLADDTTFTAGGGDWLINYNDITGGLNTAAVGTSYVTLTAVPEPSALLLGALGVAGLMRRRRI